MVLDDIYSQSPRLEGASKSERSIEDRLASPADRLAATVADFIVFVPFLALAISPWARIAKEAQLVGNDDAWIRTVLLAGGAGLLTLILYQTIFISVFGATPGKMALKLRVVSIWTGVRPRPIEAFLRALTWSLEAILLGVPWMAVFSNEKRRPFHDRISDTAVVALSPSRETGPATLAEISIASGFQSAALAVVALFAAIHLSERMSPTGQIRHSDELVVQYEAEGQLCLEVRSALEELTSRSNSRQEPRSEERPRALSAQRLDVALALFTIESIDAECLESEADFALWRNESRAKAYIAKALALKSRPETVEQSSDYFSKACATEKLEGRTTEVCAYIDLLASHGGELNEQLEDAASAKVKSVESEDRLEKIIASVDGKSSDFLRLAAVRYSLENHKSRLALELMDQPVAIHKVASWLSKERAKTLWQIGRKDEASLAMRAAVDLVDRKNHVELARWFCQNESRETCGVEVPSSCRILNESVKRSESLLLGPDVAATYANASACDLRADQSKQLDSLKALQVRMPSRESKIYVKALELIALGDPVGATRELKALLEVSSKGPFFLEAQIKLAEVARTGADIKPVQVAWQELSSTDENWRPLGDELLSNLARLQEWNELLATGLKMARYAPENRRAFELMFLAANGTGQRKVALGMLASALKLEPAPSEKQKASRLPASQSAFAEEAKKFLLEKRRSGW